MFRQGRLCCPLIPRKLKRMTAAKKQQLISVEDYLAGELVSPIKHEYVGGVVYAMAGAINRRNRIATNIVGAAHGRLRGNRCRAFNSDTKIRVRLTHHVRFYYPEASIVCRPNADVDSFQEEPAVIFEVLSRKTRRIDEGEKKDAYLTIPSLNVYVLVEQDTPSIVAYRRTDHGFVREVHEGLAAVLRLPEIGIELPMAEIYEHVEFNPEQMDGEG